MACVHSEDSDKPGHPPSRVRVFPVRSRVAKDSSFLHADSEDSGQTGRMSLRWARIYFVGFVMSYQVVFIVVETWPVGSQLRLTGQSRSRVDDSKHTFINK